jgi:hypothetical protein
MEFHEERNYGCRYMDGHVVGQSLQERAFFHSVKALKNAEKEE